MQDMQNIQDTLCRHKNNNLQQLFMDIRYLEIRRVYYSLSTTINDNIISIMFWIKTVIKILCIHVLCITLYWFAVTLPSMGDPNHSNKSILHKITELQDGPAGVQHTCTHPPRIWLRITHLTMLLFFHLFVHQCLGHHWTFKREFIFVTRGLCTATPL